MAGGLTIGGAAVAIASAGGGAGGVDGAAGVGGAMSLAASDAGWLSGGGDLASAAGGGLSGYRSETTMEVKPTKTKPTTMAAIAAYENLRMDDCAAGLSSPGLSSATIGAGVIGGSKNASISPAIHLLMSTEVIIGIPRIVSRNGKFRLQATPHQSRWKASDPSRHHFARTKATGSLLRRRFAAALELIGALASVSTPRRLAPLRAFCSQSGGGAAVRADEIVHAHVDDGGSPRRSTMKRSLFMLASFMICPNWVRAMWASIRLFHILIN